MFWYTNPVGYWYAIYFTERLEADNIFLCNKPTEWQWRQKFRLVCPAIPIDPRIPQVASLTEFQNTFDYLALPKNRQGYRTYWIPTLIGSLNKFSFRKLREECVYGTQMPPLLKFQSIGKQEVEDCQIWKNAYNVQVKYQISKHPDVV